MRKNIYLRLFLSIVLITVAVMTVQTLVLGYAAQVAEKKWKDNLFDNYIEGLSCAQASNMSFADMLYTMVDSAPDMVSGLMIRDDIGEISVSIGSSSRGDNIPQLMNIKPRQMLVDRGRFSFPKTYQISVSTTDDYSIGRLKKPEYAVDIASHFNGRDLMIDRFDLYPTGFTGFEEVKLPSVVSEDDIVGTIVFYNNGAVYGYLDILIYDMDVYGPTNILMKDLSIRFIIFLPIALAISLIAAYLISKRNMYLLKSIRKALKELAAGKYDVEIDPRVLRFDEYSFIAESIDQLGKDLKRHQKSRKEWIRNISHDLNTPVTSMGMLLDGAIDGIFPLDQDLLKEMKKENEALKQRIASVNYYSMLMSPQTVLRPEKVNLYDLVDSVLQGRSGCTLRTQNDRTDLYIDFNLIKRSLQEIIGNAYEYGKGDIVWSVDIEDGHCDMVISNKGRLPDPRPQFFEPWARGDDSRHEGGSGLGLPIVYQTMVLHGGSVEIDEVDEEVVVRLSIPQVLPPEVKES